MHRALISTLMAVAAITLLHAGPAAAGGGGHMCADRFSDGKTTEVAIEGSCFTPTVVRIEPGDTVTWTNNEGVPHTVSGAADLWGGYRDMGRGDSVSYRFDDNGVFPYFCAWHPSMVGAVVVGDGSSGNPGAVVPMGEGQMPLGTTGEAPIVERSTSPLFWGIGLGAVLLTGALILIGRRTIRSGVPRSQAG